MHHLSKPAVVCFALVGALLSSAVRGAERVVLLHNKSLLRGEVEAVDDMLQVRLRTGGQVRIRTKDVLAIFGSMDQAFAWRQQRIPQRDADRRIALAFWALRHDYPPGAVSILREQTSRGNRDQRLNVLEQELNRVAARRSPSPAPPTKPQERGYAAAEITPAARIEFHRTIEPILLKSCATVGCHGPGGQFAFRLVQPHPTASRQKADQVSHNLRTTLHQVNRKAPQASRLLRLATQAHAEQATSAPLPTSSPEYRQLAAWLDRLPGTQRTVPAQQPPTRLSSSVLLQQPPLQAGDTPSSRAPTARSPRGSRDPYDPAVFNSKPDTLHFGSASQASLH